MPCDLQGWTGFGLIGPIIRWHSRWLVPSGEFAKVFDGVSLSPFVGDVQSHMIPGMPVCLISQTPEFAAS